MASDKRLIDLSHTISHDMLTHPWMPKPLVNEYITREQSASFLAEGVTFALSQINLAGNTGTYLDAPYQFHVEGPDVAALDLERLVDIPIKLIRVDPSQLPDGRSIGPEVFEGHGDLAGTAVLIHTGHARHWATGGFFQNSPFISEDAVKHLISAGPGIVGADTQNIDSGTDMRKPAQNLLLGAGIYLIESMARLDELPDDGARLTVLPTPIAGMGSFPVRAIATVDG